MTDGEIIHNIHLRIHNEGLKDPIYCEGLKVFPTEEDPYPTCPYEIDRVLSYDILIIALKKDRLTESEGKELKELNEKFQKTEWQRWKNGYYSKFKVT